MSAGGQQKSPYEEFIMLGIIGGLLYGMGMGIWFVFHVQLTELMRYIRVLEMWVVTLVHGHNFQVFVPDTVPSDPGSHAGLKKVDDWRKALLAANVNDIGSLELRASTYIAVLALRPVFAVIMVALGIWAMFRGPNTQFHRKLNLEGLIQEQSKSFPAIAPFVNFNPIQQPFRVVGQAVPAKLPLFAEALSPEEWVTYNQIQVQGNQIDANQTYQALTKQLGGRWQGPLKLPIHAQGLYAAFALMHARKRKGKDSSEELLGLMSIHWTPEGGLKLPSSVKAKIRKVINNPKLGGALQKYADQHAYETTALLRCLKRARDEGGVLAPASFLWLRGLDRNLWYPLNNLGRRSYHAEAVGALVHYTNELIAGQKIPTPRFDEVIKGIQATITGPMARPLPPLDQTPPAIEQIKKRFFKFGK
jgi:intracellular multiplication protein IcmP